ncbi:MAG: MgtC/SapB family protein [Gemmatimonadota bacterium]
MDPSIAPETIQQAVIRLLVAACLGGAIGTNRELAAKPAGVRTHALVALGAALAALSATSLNAGGAVSADAVSRVLQGILAGVGFVGAGVILHRDDYKGAHGLTTAATIWLVAAIGVAAALGLWRLAVATTVIAILLLLAEGLINRALGPLRSDRAPRGSGDGVDDS